MGRLLNMASRTLSPFTRRIEHPYQYSFYIAEFWNTVSNLPFIILGLFRFYELAAMNHENRSLQLAYVLLAFAGIASGIHHAVNIGYKKWTIFLDWIPILLSLLLIYSQGFIFSVVSWLKIIFAISVLLVDHFLGLVPVPWGHVFWHILAAFAVDNAYQDVLYNQLSIKCME